MKFQAFLSFMVGFSMVGGLLFALRWMAHKPLFVPPKALSKTDCERSVTTPQTPLSSNLQPPSVTGTFSARTLMDRRGDSYAPSVRTTPNVRPQAGMLIPTPINRPQNLLTHI